MIQLAHKISIAPMMDYTDRHCRYFLRLFSKHLLLYTEMITAPAILHGNRDKLLGYDQSEHPLVLQLGGSNPAELAECAKIAEEWGYDEINLNVGCPSDRVQSGMFGLCLMAKPELVADCIKAMKDQVSIPVTVKTRIGYDHNDSYQELVHFIQTLEASNVDQVIIHARKGWLKGLSPKENREIPPLQYETVYQIKKDFPHLNIGINGGIQNVAEATQHLDHVDHVMIGRSAYHNPFILACIDQELHQSNQPIKTRQEIIEKLIPYIEAELAKGTSFKSISRHILGLFHGEPNARVWRRVLSDPQYQQNHSGIKLIEIALKSLSSTPDQT
ncbi:MAG: tRNA-dihydrouridine synthase [Gammaproteobacteria bacterium]|jgi:tRNA-dihydrouridine synthase A|nr:tRNA-dihydrouridine synthase [Gammaproteobacteria bacterium]